MKIINPATGECIEEIETDHFQSVQEKVKQAKVAQKKWADRSIDMRIQSIRNFAKQLEIHCDELANLLTEEVGKPITQSVNEINGARQRIQFFIDNAKKYLKDETVFESSEIIEEIHYEPLGTVANISAWNYPYLVGVNVFIPALIAGNSVIYKPSEFASLTGLKIQDLMNKSGVVEGCFQTVVGAGDVGEYLLQSELDGYFFTGSYTTGKYIAKTVAEKMVPVQLELGGKDPAYVTDDITDIVAVAESVADGAFYNNGQSCCAIERIYVHEKIYEPFLQAFLRCVNEFKLGDPKLKETYCGALTRPQHIDFLKFQISEAQEKGAVLETGGSSPKAGYFEPTVLTSVTHSMSLMKDETFGPVIGIQKVASDSEAQELMEDTRFGLTASIFSQNETRAIAILDTLSTGTVYLNCSDRVSPYLPWSGRKHSGFGLTLSHLGIRNFTHPKAYHLKTL